MRLVCSDSISGVTCILLAPLQAGVVVFARFQVGCDQLLTACERGHKRPEATNISKGRPDAQRDRLFVVEIAIRDVPVAGVVCRQNLLCQ